MNAKFPIGNPQLHLVMKVNLLMLLVVSVLSVSASIPAVADSSPTEADIKTETVPQQLAKPAPDKSTVESSETESFIDLGMTRLPVHQWSDNNVKTRAIIVAIHGASRHSGTYQTLAEHLAKLGYLVISPDMRGHGEWYFAKQASIGDKTADWDKSTDDVVSLINKLRNEHPQLPIFCIGESAGAAVAIKAATRCPAVNGLVLSAIGTRPCVHDVANIVHDAFEGMFNFDKPLAVKDIISKYSSDEERIRLNASNDPQLKPGLSARELLRTSWLLNQTAGNAAKLPAHIPVLMLQGDRDEIVTAASARTVLKKIPSREKKMLDFPYGHILLTTPFIHLDVISSVSSWLVSKTAEQQTALAGASDRGVH